MNRGVCRGTSLSTHDDKRAAGLGMTVEPMMRRRIDEWPFPDIDASPSSAEHGNSNARLGLGSFPFSFENSRPALHPIRLPRAVESAASFVVDPPIMGHEVQAREVSRRVPGLEASQAVHHTIECSLSPIRVRSTKYINEVIVC